MNDPVERVLKFDGLDKANLSCLSYQQPSAKTEINVIFVKLSEVALL